MEIIKILSCSLCLLILLIIHVALSQLMQDKFGETALIAASTKGHMKCATILMNHKADVNYQRKVRLLYVERISM